MHKKSMLAGCAFLGLAAGAMAGPYDVWTYHRDVTINTTFTGAGTTETLAQFPVLIRLANTGIAAGSDALATALPGGADVRFASADGATAYSYEIDSWTSTEATIWVRVPSVVGNATTTVRMYWGKSGEVSASNGGAVFDTTNGFVGVWHLGGAANASDATYNGLTGTNVGTTAATGVLAGARTLDGSSTYVSVPSNSKLNIPTAFTISAWVNAASWDGGSRRVIQKGTGSGSSLNAGQYGLRDNSNNSLQTDVAGTGGNAQTPAPAAGEWHLIHGTYGDGFERTYVDGTLGNSSTSSTGTIPAHATELAIGREPESSTSSYYFNGSLDEVRVQNVTRSADWIKLEFETQRPGNSTVALGTTQPPVALLPGTRELPGVRKTGRSFNYEIPAGSGIAILSVTDVSGRSVWNRSVKTASTGVRTVRWEGETIAGSRAAPGLYQVRLSIQSGAYTTRLVEEIVTLTL
jgi:hypothetical protein